MSQEYKLVNGPSRHDLLLGLTERKTLTFRGIDDGGRAHLFKVCIINLGLPIQDHDRFAWELRGFIIEKDGDNLREHGKCRAHFDSQVRRGYFSEEDLIRPYSHEYFERLSDAEIRNEIAELRKGLPEDLRELDEYMKTVNPRERLILEAIHTWNLSHACLGVKIGHQLDLAIRKNRRS